MIARVRVVALNSDCVGDRTFTFEAKDQDELLKCHLAAVKLFLTEHDTLIGCTMTVHFFIIG